MDVVVLAVVIGTILLAWRLELNVGVCGIAAAAVLGRIAGLTDKQILSTWPLSMTYMLVAVTFLCGYASTNGTLTALVNVAVSKVGRNKGAIPLVFALLCFAISAVGPGGITVFALMTPIAMELSRVMGFHPIVMTLAVVCGGSAGHLSPIAVGGVVSSGLLGKIVNSEPGLPVSIWLVTAVVEVSFFAISYLALRGWRVTATGEEGNGSSQGLTRNQKTTATILAAVYLLAIFFKVDVTIASFIGVGLCAAFRVGSNRDAAKSIPMETIITVCGMGVLIDVADKFGLVKLLSSVANSISGGIPHLALAMVSGAMSTVSSTTGVVMPVVYPTVASMQITQSVAQAFLYGAIVSGGFSSGISPLENAGAMVMANVTPEFAAKNKLFSRLFALVFLRMAWTGILLSLVG